MRIPIIIAPRSSSRIDGAAMPQPPPRILPPARRRERRATDPPVVIDGTDERLAMVRRARRLGACVRARCAPPRIKEEGARRRVCGLRGMVCVCGCGRNRVIPVQWILSSYPKATKNLDATTQDANTTTADRRYKNCAPLLNTHLPLVTFLFAWIPHCPHSLRPCPRPLERVARSQAPPPRAAAAAARALQSRRAMSQGVQQKSCRA